jgi:hypothetical protein
MDQNLRLNEEIIKIQNNELINLKGNIRIICRVRPETSEPNYKALSYPLLDIVGENHSNIDFVNTQI